MNIDQVYSHCSAATSFGHGTRGYARTRQKSQLTMKNKASRVYNLNMSQNRVHMLNCYVNILTLIITYMSLQFIPNVILSLALQANNNNNNNDAMPQLFQQHNNILHFEVSEGAPNNTFVGNIRSSDGQTPYLVVSLPQTPENELKAALNINFNNGDLTTNSILDREHRDQYHFIAIVREPFAEIKCTVTIRDVNDNAPMFVMPTPNETKFVIDVPEEQVDIRKVLPLAVDFDTPQFGIKEFRIVSGNTPSGLFKLVEHGSPSHSSVPQGTEDSSPEMLGADNPQLMQQLAQQATVLVPSQPVVVQAHALASSAIPSSSSNPILQQSSSSLLLSQSNQGASSSSSSVINNYPSSQHQQQEIAATQSKFLIDLEVIQKLNYENRTSYELVVEAIDGGQQPGRLMVTVNVQDINDNKPVFLKKLYECQLKEDAPRGSLLIEVKANDIDSGLNGQVSYYIERPTTSSQAAALASDQITNSTSDNNEVSTRFSTTNVNSGNKLRLQAPTSSGTSSANSGGSSSSTIKLTRQGNNLDSYENTAAGNDVAAAGYFKLRQNYPPDQLFDIPDPNKGEIYLVNPLDFETEQVHEIYVVARDHGKPSQSSTTKVKLTVVNVNDDPMPSAMNRIVDDGRKQMSSANLLASGSDPSRAESSTSARMGGSDFVDVITQPGFNLHYINLTTLLNQASSTALFSIVLMAMFAVALSVFLIKIKSRQPESDYNDTAGLTMASNNGQTKPSPNHSASNLDHPGTLDSIHQHHHDHQRHPNGSFAGLNGSGHGGFGAPNSKMNRHQYISDNFYHNLHSVQRPRHHSTTSHHLPHDSLVDHQMASRQGGSRGGTLTLHNHRHHQLIADHPLEHHHHQFAPLPNQNTTSSLTYAHHHSRTHLLHQSNHHQSSHHLSSIHQQVSHNKGGTMNSIGTHNSAHHAPSPATPNTSSSQMQPNIHDGSHHLHHHHHHHHGGHHNQLLPTLPSSIHHQNGGGGLPTPPCRNDSPGGTVFPWPPTQDDCFVGPDGVVMDTPGSTMNSRSTNGDGSGGGPNTASQPLDRWFDLGVSSQLVYAHDWYGSYNWDYLNDWTPEYHTLMPYVLDSPGY